MSVFVNALGWTLLHFVWQGALIGLAAALALAALRGARPQVRYLVACAALLLCILWPAAELVGRLDAAAIGLATPVSGAIETIAPSRGLLPKLQEHMTLIVLAWAACIVALCLRTTLGLLWIQRAARLGRIDAAWQLRMDRLAQAMGIRRVVCLRIVDTLASPITAGWWRPVVLVPAALMSGLPTELLQALLAHELAHVRRFDYLVNLLQNAIETLLFYHPAVWWLSRRVRAERELIADDIASAVAGGPRQLALALSELEKLQFSHHQTALAANGGDLMHRITRLLRPAQSQSSWKSAAALLTLAVACAGCASFASAQGPDDPVDTKAVADFSSCKKPEWPRSSLAAEHTGTVHLRFLISAEGRVTDYQLKSSSGDPLLDEAARVGISKCMFKPATRNGKPVAAWMQMQYIWTLH
ncbi:M56 family metallopeptidase [Massilia endophytica]|uniref:M56 family metallopeptidase n=1 Tax=Massilia endophytica TaxID=2899220 RepID=UPI001E3EBDF5|nr:M56 family metallopeptidase [Massilia endophytica]UGQ46853.1 M56 family metallopeptidase [Massilia endophytica]